ncbi:MAG: PepSY domain-containing protein [Marivibrio sp.]|uniref:PepSY domain-containing protein n=1 Tax=Marivibrio sp. TaxID=2039719 RepID=UPI0032EE7F32
MRLIDAAFGALGLVLAAGTAYAALDSDLTAARPTPVQIEHDGFEAPEGDEGYDRRDGYEDREEEEYGRSGGPIPQASAQNGQDGAGQTGGTQSGEGAQPTAQPLSLQDAIARTGAMGYTRVLEAEYEHGRYEIEALDDQGRKVEIYLDAQTGQTLKQGYDD